MESNIMKTTADFINSTAEVQVNEKNVQEKGQSN